MLPESLTFVILLILTGFLLFLLVYFVIILSDLECDYMNAQQCCSKLNFWIVPKISAHVLAVFLLLINGSWWLTSANFPMLGYLFYQVQTVPKGNMGLYDPTEIHNRGMIKIHIRDSLIQIGFYLTAFFIYLYWGINAILKGDPIRKHEDDQIVTEF